MQWTRRGVVFKPESKFDWSRSHAQVPFGFPIDEDTIRIYFGTRDAKSRTVTSFIEVAANDIGKVKYAHDKPSLGLGKLGTHDESGAMPSCVVRHEDKIYLYYTGWNVGGNVSYRTAIGLAISLDGGVTFERISDGPIIDRSLHDACFACQPFVMKEGDKWRMWYLSCTKWEMIDGHPEPFYHVKYAESADGINWERNGVVSLDFDGEIDAVGNPTVLKEGGIYKMFYSYRKADGYRRDPSTAYKLGYAESEDGIKFTKKDGAVELSGEAGEWESIMQAYPHVFTLDGKYIMLYNGNGFGQSGFGYAVSNGK